jgi:hypothetical protein
VDEHEVAGAVRRLCLTDLPAAELDSTRARIVSDGAAASPFSDRHGRRMFRCLDPDGNVLEFRELNGG